MHTLLTLPLAQVATPPPGTDPWIWLAGLLATAVGVIFWRLDGLHNTRIADCETTIDKRDATIEALRTELRDMAAAALAATAKQLEAAQEQARAHADERRLVLSLLKTHQEQEQGS